MSRVDSNDNNYRNNVEGAVLISGQTTYIIATIAEL